MNGGLPNGCAISGCVAIFFHQQYDHRNLTPCIWRQNPALKGTGSTWIGSSQWYCLWFRPPKQPPFGFIKPVVNIGLNYQTQLVSRISEPSTAVSGDRITPFILAIYIGNLEGNNPQPDLERRRKRSPWDYEPLNLQVLGAHPPSRATLPFFLASLLSGFSSVFFKENLPTLIGVLSHFLLPFIP